MEQYSALKEESKKLIFLSPGEKSVLFALYLTIITRARMGYESIAQEAEGRMGY